MTRRYKIRISHAETHKLLLLANKMLFDINGYQWYITCSGCATETCDARSRWSSMRGLHFFMPVSERKYYMAKNFLTYEQSNYIFLNMTNNLLFLITNMPLKTGRTQLLFSNRRIQISFQTCSVK